MDIDRGLVKAILREGLVEFHEQDISPDMLEASGREAFTFVDAYWRKHGKMPSLQLIEDQTAIVFHDVPYEPVTFWAEEIRKRHLYAAMQEVMDGVMGKLEAADPQSALDRFRDGFFTLERLFQHSAGVERVFDDVDDIMNEYEQSKLGITGIPTPYPALNEVTQGWQPEDLIIVAGRPGQGKCLGIDTPVLMAVGSIKKVQDIVVGDLVMGPDSRPRRVTSLARGREEMFEIRPVKGDPWTCNRSHILSLRMSSNNGSVYRAGQVFNLSVDEYLQQNGKFKHHAKQWRTGVDFSRASVPFDPYLIGLWIGDGDTKGACLSTMDQEIHEYLGQAAISMGLWLTDNIERRPGFCPRYRFTSVTRPNLLTDYLQNKCGAGDVKRVPQELLVNDRATRLALLAGWIDTDGSLADGCYEVSTKLVGLKDQLCFLARSLGFSATVQYKKSTIKSSGFVGYYWRVVISGEISEVPVKLARKRAKPRQQIKSVLNTGFKLQSLGEGDYFGFELEGPDRLFLLGDFTVTHNTSLALICGIHAWEHGRKVMIISTEMSRRAIRRRCASFMTKTSYGKLKRGKLTTIEEERFSSSLQKLKGDERMIMMGKKMKVTLESIEAQAMIHKPDMLIIDGFYLIRSARVNAKMKSDRIGEILDLTKEMAKELGIPVILTTQMNRGNEKSKGKPDLDRLAFSDNMGMIADYVFFLDRNAKMRDEREMRITPVKIREGEFFGSIISTWDFEKCEFHQRRIDDGATKPNDPGAPPPGDDDAPAGSATMPDGRFPDEDDDQRGPW